MQSIPLVGFGGIDEVCCDVTAGYYGFAFGTNCIELKDMNNASAQFEVIDNRTNTIRVPDVWTAGKIRCAETNTSAGPVAKARDIVIKAGDAVWILSPTHSERGDSNRFIVDTEGNVELGILGKTKLEGLSTSEAASRIETICRQSKLFRDCKTIVEMIPEACGAKSQSDEKHGSD